MRNRQALIEKLAETMDPENAAAFVDEVFAAALSTVAAEIETKRRYEQIVARDPTTLTLRDSFAVSALPALVAHYLPQDTPATDIADACYVLADAMLDERQKEHE